jgi:hypothetical protein
MPIFDHSAEGSLSIADLQQMQATYQDAQLLRSLKAAGVSGSNIKKSMAQLAQTDPHMFLRLSLALKRNRVLIGDKIDKNRMKELVAAGRDFHAAHERFENSYWGLAGKIAAFTKKHSPSVLAAWAFKQQFGKDGAYARNLTVQLQVSGNAAAASGWVLLKQSIEFAAVEANITEALTRHGLDHSRASKTAEEFTRYFGHNAALARQVMTRLAVSAKIANLEVGEFWNVVVEQQKEYGRGAMRTALDLQLNLKLFRDTAKELAGSHMYESYMSGDRDQTIWPQLMSESMMKWHKDSNKLGTQLGALGVVVAEAYRVAAKHGKSQKGVQREAEAYAHVARGTSWMRLRLGTQTLEALERKVRETQAAYVGMSWDEATARVLRARYGNQQLGVATAIFSAFVGGEKLSSPEEIIKLDESLDRTMLGVVSGMEAQWKQESNDSIYMHMVHAGVDSAAAAGVVATVRAGGLKDAVRNAEKTSGEMRTVQQSLKTSADYLVQTDEASTTLISRAMALTQRMFATPLGKLAAAAGLVWMKLGIDGFYKVKMLIDWFRAGMAYARIAGLTTATGTIAYLKQELQSAGVLASNLKQMAFSAGRVALPVTIGAAGIYETTQAAKWRVKEAEAQRAALQTAKAIRDPATPPRLADARQVDKLDPEEILSKYDPGEREVQTQTTVLNEVKQAAQASSTATVLTGGLQDFHDRRKPLLLTVLQQPSQAPPIVGRAATRRPPPELRRVRYQPRTEREASLVASGVPITSTGRIAISTLAQIESTRRQNEFRNLWFTAMGADVHTSETGQVFVKCRFERFAEFVSGTLIYKALSVSTRP